MRLPIIILFVTLIAFSGCQTTNDNSKPVVMVSIIPQKYFVNRIADTLVRVEVMVPPGSSPETYEPTAIQLKILNNSLAYFSLGLLDFERSMLKKIQKQNPDLNVITHSKDLDLLDGLCHGHTHGHSHSHGYDPHVWSSPVEVKKIANTITNELIRLIPEHSAQFTSNLNSFLADLDSLDLYIKTTLGETRSKKFFLFHPALTYFARDYGLTQVSLEEDGKAPSMRHFKSVVQTAREQGIKTIFIQKEFDINTAKTAAEDIGGRVVSIDPLEYQWLGNMYHITNELKNALDGN
jgi:zinc transport system substrate-binding protein